MAQADSVLSTPRINTSANHSRRRFLAQSALAGAAAAVALSIAPPAAGAEADPAFALIAKKRAADIAHCAAIDALGDAEEGDDPEAEFVAELHCENACHFANEIDWQLARITPTTLAGVAAVLRFANEIELDRGEWPDTDTVGPDGWHYQLRQSMAKALEIIMSKAVQS